jgi:hypothetical protein
LPAVVAQTAYLVVLEAVNNMVRRAQAGQVTPALGQASAARNARSVGAPTRMSRSARTAPACARTHWPTSDTSSSAGTADFVHNAETQLTLFLVIGRREQLSLPCAPCVPRGCNQRASAAATCTSITRCSRLARWTRCLRNEKVRGSSPLSSTKSCSFETLT